MLVGFKTEHLSSLFGDAERLQHLHQSVIAKPRKGSQVGHVSKHLVVVEDCDRLPTINVLCILWVVGIGVVESLHGIAKVLIICMNVSLRLMQRHCISFHNMA